METYLSDADNQVVVIVADGGLNHGTASQIYDVVLKSIECGLRCVIVDCSKLDIVTSTGLAKMLLLHKRMRELGGEVKLANVQGFVAQVLTLTRLDKVFEMYPDVAQARLSFRPTS
ncbi:MAG: STAS domain-containing protein [Phycisphaerae bacterium]|nr:STAS domain-containing protein [Phycisphaerae bacterium]